MSQDPHDAVNVAQLFTRAIEKAMEAGKLGTVGNSAERNRARHEAVAQYLLDHILLQEGQLERFLEVVGVTIENTPVLYTEWSDPETASRFDHVVDDAAEESYRSVLVIEEKLDAQLAPDQLDRYCAFLADQDGPATLLVLHPMRNPLTSEKSRIAALSAEHPGVTVKFMTWSGLCEAVIAAAPDSPEVALWRALEEFAENVGTGDLESLPDAELLNDPVVAKEVHDVFCTMQNVAARVGSGRSRQLRFSFHGGNAVPWLQMAMSDTAKNSVGLELNVLREPGTLRAGFRGPDAPWGEYINTKIGSFPDGKLSPAAVRRAEEIARLSVDVRDHGAVFPQQLPGRSAGAPVSDDGQDAISLLATVFQAQAIKNPHRGGAPSRSTRGVNEGKNNERLGAVLVKDEGDEPRSIYLFIGPPAGQPWERCTLWIREQDSEREIAVNPGESGRAYVLRVWSEARHALRERGE